MSENFHFPKYLGSDIKINEKAVRGVYEQHEFSRATLD